MAKSFMRSSTISIWILISIFTGKTFQSGFFELQILEVTNVNSRIANGRCCGNSSVAVESETANSLYKLSSSGSSNYVNCPRCSTAFRLCLKEFQKSASSRASDWQGCAYGNASTQILGASSFRLADHPTNIGGMKLNFTFRWTESFTLILQALDIVSSTSSALIEEASYSGIKLPSRDWDTLEHVGKIAQFTYRFRVTCDNNYYSNTCNEFCRKRDDAFGHYDCAHNGTKLCHPGWNGDNCDRAICKPGCHPDHGSCIRPGECECRSNSGWRGPLCNECMPYPGCRHGTCKDAPWQCICDRNWGGILCDQDLNYCGTHEPCLHGGTCENTAPDKYRCTCAEGLSGDRCEIVEEPCAPQPCKNGGTCRSHDMQKYKKPINATVNYRSVQGGGVMGKPGRSLDRNPAVRLIQNEPPKTKEVINNYTCICANGYAGPNCEIDIDECASRPCANEGTCVDLVGGFRCECPIEWTGEFCHLDVNECESNSASTFGPCINADECQNLDGGFRCICQVGWSGETCTKNIDDCIGSCQNGATCIDLVNDFHCSCPEGFSGKNCSLNVNECLDTPCKNGGECIDLHGSYECRCPVGYFGTNCEEITNHCEPSPCNGGKCINTPGSFYCQCPVGRTGARCELFHTFCGSQSCNGVDICKTSPCKNGGTCTKVDNGFACQCTYGWSGSNCTERVIGCQSKDCQTDCLYSSNPSACALSSNLCEPNPCHNGGTCEFGEGWFRCLCAKGFDGSVCRVNVNECASSPCHGGGTCRDEIGDFTCICPPGRRGNQCEIVLSDGNEEHVCSNTSTARASDNRCNFCVCSNGIPRCSDLWCGLENCFSPNGTTCGSREVCVPQSKETCLGHPCTPRGDCRELEPLKRVAPPMYPADTNCWPNQIKLNEKCARISVTLQTTSLPAGTSVEDVCHTMRVFLGVYTAQKAFTHTSTQTVLLCENKETFNDVIEVAIFSQAGRAAQVADVLGEIMSRRPATIEMLALTDTFELSVLRSILEVRVETALLSEGAAEKGFQFFLISAICLTIVSVIMFALLLFRRRAYPHLDSGSHLPSDLSRCHEEEKSNNLQNEENFRRYANPLKGSSSSLKGAVELSSAPDPTLQPRAGPSGLNRSQPYLATCDMEYEIDNGGDLKGGGKRASQLLLQKTPNTDLSRNTMMETKDFDKMNKMNKQSPNAAISDSNLLTVHV